MTCIGDALKSNVAKQSVLLLEQLGCKITFLEQQGCCGQPALNSGYVLSAIPGMKKLIETFEVNDYPIVAPAGSCVYAIKTYAEYLKEEPEWLRALKKWRIVLRFNRFYCESVKGCQCGAKLAGNAVYHPSCSLFRKLGVKEEPVKLLQQVEGLNLLPIHNQETCCGFGGTFSVKMAEISGEMVKEKYSILWR